LGNVIAQALTHLEQNGEQFWATADNESEMTKGGIAHAIEFMDLKSDRASAAVERLLVAHTFNSDLTVKNGTEVGNKVMDQSGEYTIFRMVSGKSAVAEARAEGLKPDGAMRKVTTMYEGQNPIKIVFKSPPTEQEYHKLTAQLPDNGRQSVIQSLIFTSITAARSGLTAACLPKRNRNPRKWSGMT